MPTVPQIDPDSPVAQYRQIAEWIIARIQAEELKPDRPIPSETTLVQAWGVARGTARHAVEWLRDEGWVYTIPQRGTYVRRPEDRPPG